MMGAREVLRSCAGWLIVSASKTTNCRLLASSNILSISLCTSAESERETGMRTGTILIIKQQMILHTKNTLSLFIFIYSLALVCCRSPRLERVFDRSMIAFLFSTDLLARDRSAVTRVIEILPLKTFPRETKTTFSNIAHKLYGPLLWYFMVLFDILKLENIIKPVHFHYTCI